MLKSERLCLENVWYFSLINDWLIHLNPFQLINYLTNCLVWFGRVLVGKDVLITSRSAVYWFSSALWLFVSAAKNMRFWLQLLYGEAVECLALHTHTHKHTNTRMQTQSLSIHQSCN